MSNHPTWHDQQPQYSSGPPQQRHHPNMDPYTGPSPSSQQAGPYSNAPHGSSYAQAHLPPPTSRQTPQQSWTPSAPQEFGGPSPSNSATRSSGPYNSAFDAGLTSIGSTNSPMRQHGAHVSPYASQSPYGQPPSHPPSEQQLHPSQRGGMPGQYDFNSSHGPNAYAGHPHHASSQSQSQQQSMSSQHHPHPSQQHWNTAPAPLPSVLQPQTLQAASDHPSNRGGPGHALDRSFGGPKQEEDVDDDDAAAYDDYDGKGKNRAGDGAQAANKGTSDFVKKLFSMLDDKAYESVVAWSPAGESFIVKDMNDFTKHVLPRNFRHSNFASFVRQLNKYDFHKVKNPEDGSGTVGEHVWEFQHPDFIRGREDLLENVKRKIPAKKKSTLKGALQDGDRDDSPTIPLPIVEGDDRSGESYADLKAQVANLTAIQDQMQHHILALTKQYQGVIGEMLTFQRNMVQQDQLMQHLIQYLMNLEQDRGGDGSAGPASFLQQQSSNAANARSDAPFAAMGPFENVASSSYPQMNDLSRRAADANLGSATAVPHSASSSAQSVPNSSASTNAASSSRLSGMTSAPSTAAPLSPKSVASPMDGNNGKTPEVSQQLASLRDSNPHAPMVIPPPQLGERAPDSTLVNAAASAVRNPSLSNFEKAGLRVLTVGTLEPRQDGGDGAAGAPASVGKVLPASQFEQGSGTTPKSESQKAISPFDSNGSRKDSQSNGSKRQGSESGQGNYLRVRRQTLVPGWAVPPRVLLVDDDEVCRRLSSKFLQVFGCSIDYAVDGMSAVNKMNLEKYDLVLMDIVMPNLDGISATSLIRQFDPKTPIISMTSNSGPSEFINYMSSGMTDILPKPFTKEGLLNMLEKHLLHLKAAKEQNPRGLSIGSSDGAFGQALGVKGVSPMPGGLAGGSTPSNGAMNTDQADGSLNPLAGMGFTDEEYVAMLQNLIAAGTGDDDDGLGSMAAAGLVGGDGGMTATDNNAASAGRQAVAADASRDGFNHHSLKRSSPSVHDDALRGHQHHHQHKQSMDAHKRTRFNRDLPLS